MEFKIFTDDFKIALEKVEKGIAKKSALPILEAVKIEIKEDHCYLISDDLEKRIETKRNTISENMEGSFILENPKKILKAVKLFKEMETKFNITDKKITIISGNKQIEIINKFNPKDFPEGRNIGEIKEQHNYNSKQLKERYNLIKYAASKDISRPILTGICFRNNIMIACDSYRLATNTDDNLTISSKNIVLPSENIKLITDILEGSLTINISNKYFIAEDENTKITSRIFEGEYPDINRIIPTNGEILTINSKEFIEELKYFKDMTNKNDFKVAFKNGKLEVVTNEGKYKSEIETEGQTLDYYVVFDGNYMLEALKQFEGKIDIYFIGQKAPIKIIQENNLALVLPIYSKDAVYFADDTKAA